MSEDTTKKPRYFEGRNGFIDGAKFIEVRDADCYVHLVDGRKVLEPSLKVGDIEERVRYGLWIEHDEIPDGTLAELVDRVELMGIVSLNEVTGGRLKFSQLKATVETLGDLLAVGEANLDEPAIRMALGDVAMKVVLSCQTLGHPFMQCLRSVVQVAEAAAGADILGQEEEGEEVPDNILKGDFNA